MEWASKDPYDFFSTVILALMSLFLASAILSWKLAKMIGKRSKRRNKNIKKILQKLNDWKKHWRHEQALQPEENRLEKYSALEGPSKVSFQILWWYFLVNKVWAYGRIMLVLTCTVATFQLQYRSRLTVTINWLLVCYKFFVTDLVICLFATYVLILKWKHPV